MKGRGAKGAKGRREGHEGAMWGLGWMKGRRKGGEWEKEKRAV
jgi:hypothetical protein